MFGAVKSSPTQTAASRTRQTDHIFYVIAAGMMVIMTAVGFRFFILHGKGFGGEEITRQIVPLVIAHGMAMFSWIGLFFVQSCLILTGKRHLHVRLGIAGAVLAVAIVILGSTTAVLSVHFNPPIYQPFGGARLFLAIMLSEMVIFGALVSIGLSYRHRPEIHRPMMLLATVVLSSGALARFPYTGDLAVKAPLYTHYPVLLLGAVLFLLQWAMVRKPNRWLGLGYAGLLAATLLSVVVAYSAFWNHLAANIVP